MRRGDFVTVAAPGDYGMPRPALVVQSELFDELPSVTLCLVTSDLRNAPIFRYGRSISRKWPPANFPDSGGQDDDGGERTTGRFDDAALLKVGRSLSVFLGMA